MSGDLGEALDAATGNVPLYTVRVRPVGTPQRLEDVTAWDVGVDQFPDQVLLTHPDPSEEMILVRLAEKLDRLPGSISVKVTRDYVGLAPH